MASEADDQRRRLVIKDSVRPTIVLLHRERSKGVSVAYGFLLYALMMRLNLRCYILRNSAETARISKEQKMSRRD